MESGGFNRHNSEGVGPVELRSHFPFGAVSYGQSYSMAKTDYKA